jgi:DNA-binding response OmpR family regulator
MNTVVLIEDEASISEPLALALQGQGFEVHIAATGGDGLALVRTVKPDLVLLDLGLPDIDGRDVCRTLRTSTDVPVIMLTARGDETDRVVGLELGADDYVVKPFSVAELTARMRAVLRRAAVVTAPSAEEATETPSGNLTIGEVVLDERTWAVSVGGEAVTLARREFELLRLLMQNAGTVMKREVLMEEVWDPNWFGPTKTLDVHVSALRRKLGDDPQNPRYIHTVRGVGFRFAAAEEVES